MSSSWAIYSCIFQSHLWFIWKRPAVLVWLRFMSINFQLLHDLVHCWSHATSTFWQKINVKYVFTSQTQLYSLYSVSDLLPVDVLMFVLMFFIISTGSFFSPSSFSILKYTMQLVHWQDLFTSKKLLWSVYFAASDVLKTWQKGNKQVKYIN